jgi:hypothetical protein
VAAHYGAPIEHFVTFISRQILIDKHMVKVAQEPYRGKPDFWFDEGGKGKESL